MKKILLSSKKIGSILIVQLILLLAVNTVNGQINTLNNWSNQYHGIATTTQNITYAIPQGSNSNRMLVVAIATSRTTVGARTVALAYGGQSLTSVTGDMAITTVQQHTQIYYLNEAGLDAATNATLSVTVSGGTTRVTDVFVAVFDGVDQTTPITNSQNYSGGTTARTTFQFSTALTVNANDQAVEIISSMRLGNTTARTITYATNWTMAAQQTWITTDGVRNAVANRSVPASNATDVSSTTFSGTALASMTGMSLKAYVPKYFRSLAAGNWNNTTTWQQSVDGTTWVTASSTPTRLDNSITIQSPHIITVTVPVSVDQVNVNTGGQITLNSGQTLTVEDGSGDDLTVNGTVVNSGTITINGTVAFNDSSTYQHAQNGGTIPTATWITTSNCIITGITSASGLAGLGQTFGNFIWNCTGQTGTLFMESNMTVAGNFSILSTGTLADHNLYSLRMSNAATGYAITINGNVLISNNSAFKMNNGSGSCTMNVGGNFTLNSGNFTITSGTANSTVNITGNVNIAGGTFALKEDANAYTGTLNVKGNLIQSGGTMTVLDANGGMGAINFNGTTTQTYQKTAGTIANEINFTVISGSILDLGTSVIDGSTGTFTLNAGAGIITAHAQGLSTINATGSIRVTGTKTYDNNANYTYNGSSAQVTGNGLTGANNLTINNSAGVTLSAPTTVSGTVTLASGILTSNSTNTLAITNNSTSALTGGSTARFVNGPLIWQLATAQTYSFPIGKGATYLPFGLTSITGTTPRIRAEAFILSAGGSPASPLESLSTTEYWQASVISGTYTTGSVSLTRQTALGGLTAIGRSATQAGAYTTLNGSVSGTSINNSDGTGSTLGYFVMATKLFITTGTISPSIYCQGGAVSIPYTAVGTFSGNTFTAQLSSAAGDFTSAVNIGTLTSNVSGIISGIIPAGATAGTGYRIRVMSSSPNVIGADNGSNITVIVTPSAPTAIGSAICIGSTTLLSASGAVAGDRYNWYSAATGGTLLKTSTDNADNTYPTAVLGATTNFWVSLLNASGCESSRTQVTATHPVISPDDQNLAGTDSWVGHLYDGVNFNSYYGTFTETETFDRNFSGEVVCFPLSSSLDSRSVYTETFSVRYRMNSTKSGLYIADLGSDDGGRLSVDGMLLYDNWLDQAFTTRPSVLMSLNGGSSMTYEFYENGGVNRIVFQNLTLVLSNTLNTNVSQGICLGNSGSAISGDVYGSLPTGITLSGTGYQWTYSTTPDGTRTSISGATGATYTPNTAVAPFNVAGTYYIFRNAVLSSVNNVFPIPYVATNESNAATVTVTNLPVATFSYSGTPYCNNTVNPTPTFSGGGVAGVFSSTTGLEFVSTATGEINLATSIPGTYTVTNTVAEFDECGIVATSFDISITAAPTITGVTTCAGGSGSLLVTSSCSDITSLTSGPNNPGSGISVPGVGTLAWSNPENVTTVGSPYVTANFTSGNSPIVSNYLEATNYGFSIPSSATITGIEVSINRFSEREVYDQVVSLIVNGSIVGDNKAALATPWPNTMEIATYGGASDLWSISASTMTPAILNASNFGVSIVAQKPNGVVRTASIDYIQVKVYYNYIESINWYNVPSGGTPIGAGSSFNPVGVAGGLADTNTAGTFPFYAECSANNVCRARADFVINPLPVAIFSYTGTPYCKNAANPLPTFNGAGIAGSFSSSPGLVFVSTSTGEVNLASSTAGTYFVTNTIAPSGECGIVTATSPITITSLPQIQASTVSVIQCGASGNPVAVITVNMQNGLDPNDYEFSIDGGAFQSNNVFTITATQPDGSDIIGTSHNVTVRDGFLCNEVTENNIIIPSISPFLVNAGSDINMCEGQSGIQLNASGGIYYTWTSSPASGVNYLSATNVPNPTVSNTIPSGTYIFTVTAQDQPGTDPACQGTDDMLLTVGQRPEVTATASDYTVCSSTSVQLNTSVTNGGSNPAYLWSPSGNLSSATAANPVYTPDVSSYLAQTFTVTVTSDDGCPVSVNTPVVEVFPAPLITTGAIVNASCGSSNGSATVSASSPGTSPVPPFTYLWDVAAGNQTTLTATNLAAGTYMVTVTDVNHGCSNSELVTVGILPDSTPPTAVCQNISVTLDGTGNATITPQDIDNGSSDNCTVAGSLVLSLNKSTFNLSNIGPNTVILTVTDAANNSSTCNATVTVIFPANCNITGSRTIWLEQFPDANGTQDDPAGDWTTSVNTVDFSVQSNAVRSVNQYSSSTWTSKSIDISSYTNLNIKIDTWEIGNLNADDYIAFAYSVNGGAYHPFANNETIYDDYGGSSASPINACTNVPDGSSVRIRVTVKENNNENHLFDNVRLTGDPAMEAPANITNVSCNGGNNGAINVTVTKAVAPYTYVWTTTNVSGLVANAEDQTGLKAGAYNLVVTDANLVASNPFIYTITQPSADLAINTSLAVNDATTCNPASGNIIFTISNAGNGIKYELKTTAGASLSPAVFGTGNGSNLNLTLLQANLPTSTTTYKVVATSPSGCSTADLTDQPTLTVNTTPVPTGPASQNFCSANPQKISDLSVTGNGIIWYNAPSGGSILPGTMLLVDGTTYYATQTLNGCESSTRLAVTVRASSTPTISSVTHGVICGSGTTTLQATSNGGTISWHNASAGGSVLGTGTSFPTPNISATTSYWVEASNNGCTTSIRSEVYATVYTMPGIILGSDPIACNGAGSANLPYSLLIGGANRYSINFDGTSEGAGFLDVVDNVLPASPIIISLPGSAPDGIYNATLSVKNLLNGCSSIEYPITITLSANTVIDIQPSDPAAICEGSGTANISVTAAGSGLTYQWYVDGTTALIEAAPYSGVNSPTLAITNPEAILNGKQYTVRVLAACGSQLISNAATLTVNINPATPSGSQNQVFCSSDNPTVDDLIVTGSTIIWHDALSGGNIYSGTTDLINGNSYFASQTVNGCESSNRLGVLVTVTPMPTATITYSGTPFCSNTGVQTVSLSGTGAYAGGTYSAPAGLSINSFTGNIDLGASTAGTYTVTYTIAAAGGCSVQTATTSVTINPVAVIADITAVNCSGEGFSIVPANGVDIVPAGTTYSWTAPVVAGITGTAAGTNAANISGTLTNTTNAAINVAYTVTPTSGSCTGSTFTVTVTVSPKPSVNNMTATICSGGTFTSLPANGTNGIVPAGTTYTWTAMVVAGITGITAGTNAANISGTLTNTTNAAIDVVYTVTPTSGSCIGSTFAVIVTVSPKPSVNNMTATICSGGTFTSLPANGTNGIVPAGTTYTWTAPVVADITGTIAGTNAANISGTLTNTTNAAINVVYTATPTSGSCTGSTFTVTVTVSPKPSVNNMTATICSGETFTSLPANGTNGIVPAGTTYTWTAPVVAGITGTDAGTNAANISGTLTNTTNAAINVVYTVTPTSGSCTGSTFTVTVTVSPKPSVNNMTATICSGGTFTSLPANGTNGIVPAGTTYTWTAMVVAGITGITAGTNAANISGTLTNTTNAAIDVVYTLTPTSGSCIGSTFTVTVTVSPKPSVNNMTATICSGRTFTSLPANGTNGIVPAGTTYTWTAPVVADITGTIAGTNAANISGTLTNTTNAAINVVYTVTPTSGSCIGSTFTVTVTVSPKPSVNNMTATICSDGTFTSLPANGTNGIVPAGTTYTWTAPVVAGITGTIARTNAANISGTITNTTNVAINVVYTVTPTTGSCTGSAFTVTVTVSPKPSVNNMTATICSGETFTSVPANGTNGIVPAVTTYSWTAPVVAGITGTVAGNNAANISGTLTNTTNAAINVIYTVTPTSGSCIGSTFTVTVTVSPKPSVNNMTATICSGETFASLPANGTNGIVPAGTTYTWTAPVVAGITGTVAGTNEVNITGTLINSTNETIIVVYTITPNAGICNGNTFTVSVTVNPDGSWTGAIDNDWNNPGNWACNEIPSIVTNVIIANGRPNYPTLSSGNTGTANNLTIESNASVTVNGNTLQIAGFIVNSGTFTAATATIEMKGTAAQTIGPSVFAGNSIRNLTIDNSAGTTLQGPLYVTGIATALDGNLSSGGNLTLVSTVSQTALIDGIGAGEVLGNVNMQRYLPSAFGYKYFSSPFQSATVGEFASEVNLSASFPAFYKYDENNSIDTAGVTVYTSGWAKYVNQGDPLVPLAGYAANFGSDQAAGAITVSMTGVVNNGTLQTSLYNHNRKYTKGFNLVGNPYPSPIDWNATGWTRTNIDNAIYFFNASGSQYSGTYSSYVNGVSSGNANNVISAMQGFFVHVSDGAYPVEGTLGVTNSVRINNLNPVFKRAFIDTRSILRFTASFATKNALGDSTVIYFDNSANLRFDQELDALKMNNTDLLVPNLYTLTPEARQLSINGMPFPADSLSIIPLGITTLTDGWINLKAQDISQLPAYLYIYLVDAETGRTRDLRQFPEYRFNLKSGVYNQRFTLVFSLSELTEANDATEKMFTLSRSGNVLSVRVNLPVSAKGNLMVTNMLGQILLRRAVYGKETVEINQSVTGVYIISLISGKKIDSEKILMRKDYE